MRDTVLNIAHYIYIYFFLTRAKTPYIPQICHTHLKSIITLLHEDRKTSFMNLIKLKLLKTVILFSNPVTKSIYGRKIAKK